MKADSHGHRIIPVKSLLDSKDDNKKPFLISHKHHSSTVDHSIANHKIDTANAATKNETFSSQPNHLKYKEFSKGVSLNKNGNSKINNYIHQQYKQSQNIQIPLFYAPKKSQEFIETNPSHQSSRQQCHNPEYKINSTPKNEQLSYRQIKQEIKDMNKHKSYQKYSEELDKDSIKLDKYISMFEQETRHGSRFQRSESQPIYKDEMTKIKTELFQKEANLFERTQELQSKQNIIRQLNKRLELTLDLNKNLKSKLAFFQEEIKLLNEQINNKKAQNQHLKVDFKQQLSRLQKKLQQKNHEIAYVKQALSKTKQDMLKQCQLNNTTFQLINLKIRQYELEERQKIQQLTELQGKEKSSKENYDKIINGLNELLKQKEEQLVQIGETAVLFKEQAKYLKQTLNQNIITSSVDVANREKVIMELSAEISDLKGSLRNMEMRIREMIEEEEELKKQMEQQKKEISQINNIKIDQEKQNKELKMKILKRQDQSKKYKSKIAQLESKEHQNNARHRSLSIELCNNNSNKSSNARSPSVSKLMKQNQRLNTVVKDFDCRLYNFYKLNQSINQELTKRELEIINLRLQHKYGPLSDHQ